MKVAFKLKMKRTAWSQCLGLLLLLMARTAPAQDKELAHVNYTVSALHYHDSSATARQLDVRLRMPVYRGDRWNVGVSTSYKHLGLARFPDGYAPSLHGWTIQGAIMNQMTSRRSLTFFVQAGLFSDMKDVSSKDFRYGAGFRYRLRHSDHLSTGWGLAYSRQFFGNQIVPFIDIDYKPDDHWTIAGQFPNKPKVQYQFSRKLRAGFELNGEAASYRLSALERSNQFIQVNQWTGLGSVEYHFARAWKLQMAVGASLKQSYKLYNDAATTPWTIITIPVGSKADPIRKVDGKGLILQLGIAFSPLGE